MNNLLSIVPALRKRALIFTVQLLVVLATYAASFIARFDFVPSSVPQVQWEMFLQGVPILVLLRMGALWYFNLYRGLWRYVSVFDLVQIAKASATSSILFTVVVLVWFDTSSYPESIIVIDFAANLLGLAGIRVVSRLGWERRRHGIIAPAVNVQRVLIIGAGDAGVSICREALRNNRWSYKPVALLDDDLRKVGDSIFDVPIVGTTSQLAEVASSMAADLVILATPSASLEQRRALVARCLEIGVPFRVLPPVSQVLKEEALLVQLRAIEPEDLMIRDPAVLDKQLIEGVVRGKRVLITGAAGSVGSELVKQIAAYPNVMVICVDHAENPLLMLEKHLRAQHPDIRIVTLIADIADPAQIGPIFREYKPDIVFHAAAFKHVSFMENAPAQALRNNVGGTITVSRCAMAAEVEQFILVSTDKAVKPSSVMGATKRVAELLVRSFNDETPTRFTIVRFGNVLGSNGSVVPIFKEQIEHGGPLTVTDREATRYFMSIAEAAGLVLQATAMSVGGDIFQLDMGEPVKILDLAETMISLSGRQPYRDMEIVFTGLMPGEKLHEQLAEPYETFSGTAHPKLFSSEATLAQPCFVEWVLELLSTLGEAETALQIRLRIRNLLPEYSPV
jgi:FlaA1/EpsC-like NDP-sugar epimerase